MDRNRDHGHPARLTRGPADPDPRPCTIVTAHGFHVSVQPLAPPASPTTATERADPASAPAPTAVVVAAVHNGSEAHLHLDASTGPAGSAAPLVVTVGRRSSPSSSAALDRTAAVVLVPSAGPDSPWHPVRALNFAPDSPAAFVSKDGSAFASTVLPAAATDGASAALPSATRFRVEFWPLATTSPAAGAPPRCAAPTPVAAVTVLVRWSTGALPGAGEPDLAAPVSPPASNASSSPQPALYHSGAVADSNQGEWMYPSPPSALLPRRRHHHDAPARPSPYDRPPLRSPPRKRAAPPPPHQPLPPVPLEPNPSVYVPAVGGASRARLPSTTSATSVSASTAAASMAKAAAARWMQGAAAAPSMLR
ncbi:hypothetical protein H9P43_001951 [Blastocladiella emersonii ATCC 22665]|nr:hypothetical protein H9P43_001951 [Blastocladiella emersonii ATCC 22665]